MSWLRRILLSAATLLSLVLMCVAGGVAVLAPTTAKGVVISEARASVWWVVIDRGQIVVAAIRELPPSLSYAAAGPPHVRPLPATLEGRDLGVFAYAHGRAAAHPGTVPVPEVYWPALKDFPYVRVAVPGWSAAGLFALLPFGRLLRRLRRRARTANRRAAGLCAACGYDCRATPVRCPECGREAFAAAKEAAEPRASS